MSPTGLFLFKAQVRLSRRAPRTVDCGRQIYGWCSVKKSPRCYNLFRRFCTNSLWKKLSQNQHLCYPDKEDPQEGRSEYLPYREAIGSFLYLSNQQNSTSPSIRCQLCQQETRKPYKLRHRLCEAYIPRYMNAPNVESAS